VHVSLDLSGPQDVGGGMGVDTLFRLASLVGSAFNDTLTAPNQTSLGAQLSDALFGSGGDDLLQGGLGADTFLPGPGNDTVLGGGGIDTVIYADDSVGTILTGGVTVDLRVTGAQAIGGGMGVDTLESIENVVGGRFGDTLSGNQGDNQLTGAGGDDSLSGFGGNDSLDASSGADTLSGGDGDDRLTGGVAGRAVMRGDAGDDTLIVIADPDDVNGNTGNDTVTAQFSVGAVSVWLRGGRGDDSIVGGAGGDFISGDRGNDTESGGAGADLFHGSQDAGIDRVLDFHVAEGDRVMLDPGTTYTVSQVGADTVLDMGAGNQMILVGVSMSSLTASSIFFG
jgi:Ca2+-binding RTX toxin-like protein